RRRPITRFDLRERGLFELLRQRVLISNHRWQAHRKLRTLVVTGAVSQYSAAMQFDEMSHDREPQSEAAISSRRRSVSLPETIEHVWQEVRIDPDTRVVHNDLDMRIDALQRHLDEAALARKLHAIRQKVPDDLLQPLTIAKHWSNTRFEQHLQSHTLR